jgi:hypothetical protein
MENDLKRLSELWKLGNPTEEEKTEFFELVTKYKFIDLFEVEKCYVVVFKYLDRTDSALHRETIYAVNSATAVDKLYQKHSNIEWHTVEYCNETKID